MRGFFVTGTDTGVGKTELSCALAAHWVAAGEKVAVRKPVESGCEEIDGQLHPADAAQLQQAAGGWEDVRTVCPYRFAPAISPEEAALQAGTTVALEQLVAACELTQADILLVEGAGGWLSPMAQQVSNADLAKALGLPVLLVVADRLGCLNHTLLTIEAILARDCKLEAIYLMETQTPVPGTLEALKRWQDYPVHALPLVAKEKPWQKLRNVLTSP